MEFSDLPSDLTNQTAVGLSAVISQNMKSNSKILCKTIISNSVL